MIDAAYEEVLDELRNGEPRPELHWLEGQILIAQGNRASGIEELARAFVLSEDLEWILQGYPLEPRLARAVPSAARWARFALDAVGARLEGDTARERLLLLDAARQLPDRALYLGIARIERGRGSELEVFALERALRGSRWVEGHMRLARAHREKGDLVAARRTLERLLDEDANCSEALELVAELDRLLAQMAA